LKKRKAAKKRKRVPNPGGKAGMPMHQPSDFDRGRVQAWASSGMQLRVIAMMLGISHNTVDKHYRRELEDGREMERGNLHHRQWEFAMGKHGATVREQQRSGQFLLNTKHKYANRTDVEVSGADGGPVTLIQTVVVDPAKRKES